jgi:hypothetical protein
VPFAKPAASYAPAECSDGLQGGYLSNPRFWPVVERDLADGQHRSPAAAGPEPLFTTSYFHRPDDLRAEVEEAGFTLTDLLGVEGPGWLLVDRWDDEIERENILRVARILEREPTVIGTSSHLLAIARRD